jgi:sortase (surface protein transpeptidase)
MSKVIKKRIFLFADLIITFVKKIRILKITQEREIYNDAERKKNLS